MGGVRTRISASRCTAPQGGPNIAGGVGLRTWACLAQTPLKAKPRGKPGDLLDVVFLQKIDSFFKDNGAG